MSHIKIVEFVWTHLLFHMFSSHWNGVIWQLTPNQHSFTYIGMIEAVGSEKKEDTRMPEENLQPSGFSTCKMLIL